MDMHLYIRERRLSPDSTIAYLEKLEDGKFVTIGTFPDFYTAACFVSSLYENKGKTEEKPC